MAHFGARAFSEISGEVVQTVAFVMQGHNLGKYRPVFFRLVEGLETEKDLGLRAGRNRFDRIAQDDFREIPGSPIAYWISSNLRTAFVINPSIGSIADTRKGMATGDNNQFVRLWPEVSIEKVGFDLKRDVASKSKLKWFPYANGGPYKKWFGNIEDVVLWENDGQILQTDLHETGRIRAVNINLDYIFKQGLTWTSISSTDFSARFMPQGCLFSSAANSLFAEGKRLMPILGELNSCVFSYLAKVVNPTLNMNPGDTGKIPFPLRDGLNEAVEIIVLQLIQISRKNWDSNEISWNFKKVSWINGVTGAGKLSREWEKFARERHEQLV